MMLLASSLADAINEATADYQPDDLIDVLGLLVSNAPAIIAAIAGCSALVVAIRGQKKGVARWKRDRKLLDDVHKQTVNDHAEEDNFREQVDRMEAMQKRQEAAQKRTEEKIDALNQRQAEMRELQIDHGKDIGGIRDDVGQLRGSDRVIKEEHDDLVRRLNGFIRREHPGADPL